MNLDTLIPFWMKHNAAIIESLIGLSLLITAFLSIRSFLNAKNPAGAVIGGEAGLDVSQLEKTLKQILEKAGQVPSVAAASASGNSSTAAQATASGSNSEDGAKLLLEITNLKTDLQAKQRQIEDLKSAPASAAPGMSESDKAALNNQLQELQAKLAEYEIISEDIADLSFYKEQNAKLQKELEAYKSGGAPPPATAPAASEMSTPIEKIETAAKRPEPEIVGRASKLDLPEEKEEIFEPPVEIPVSEAVSEIPGSGSSAAASPAEALSPAGDSSGIDNSIDDDLMAEFAAAVEKQKAETSGGSSASGKSDLGDLDMEKMLSEAAHISTDGPDIDAAKALGTGLDENKLLKEAAALDSISNEDKKLMGQFENFVKKNE